MTIAPQVKTLSAEDEQLIKQASQLLEGMFVRKSYSCELGDRESHARGKRNALNQHTSATHIHANNNTISQKILVKKPKRSLRTPSKMQLHLKGE